MSNVIETMVKHPIKSAVIITTAVNGVINIIATLKGKEAKPFLVINISDKKLKND